MIEYCNLTTGQSLKKYHGHAGHINCVQPMGNDRLISCSSDLTIRMWDKASRTCLKTLRIVNEIFSFKVIDANRLLACTGLSIQLWNLEVGECLKTFEDHDEYVNCVEVMANNRFASGSRDTTIKVCLT